MKILHHSSVGFISTLFLPSIIGFSTFARPLFSRGNVLSSYSRGNVLLSTPSIKSIDMEAYSTTTSSSNSTSSFSTSSTSSSFYHVGFKVVTDVITSNKKRGLMWVVGLITFFMSAVLDNLTTTIVMVSLVKKVKWIISY